MPKHAKERLFLCIAAALAGIGAFLVRDAVGTDSITWMIIYDVSDFTRLATIKQYILDLKIPIPIVLSLLEIAAYNLFGSTFIISVVCYRIVIVANFILSIKLASTSISKMVFSTVISLIFLSGSVFVHQGNPQTYDVFFAFFTLLYIASLQYLTTQSGPEAQLNLNIPKKERSVGAGLKPASTKANPKTEHRDRSEIILACLFSGFCLSMVELLRPFVFFLLPFLLFCTYQALKRLPLKYFLYFLIPILLFSGTWHGNLLLRHGQITWTNVSGYNLHRAWPMVELPSAVTWPETEPIAPGRWPNLNTAAHHAYSQAVQKEILKYIVHHPLKSTVHILQRLVHFSSAPTTLYEINFQHWRLQVYRPFVWLTIVWLWGNFALLCFLVLKDRRLSLLGIPENILIFTTAFYVFVLAIGESGEETRFLVSVLPLLAVLPRCRTKVRN